MFAFIYKQPWHVLLCLMPLMIILYGLVCWQCKRWLNGLNRIGFAVWFAAVLFQVLLIRSVGERNSFQLLFESYRHLAQNNEVIRSNFANILLFFPGGMLLFMCLPERMQSAKRFCLTAVILCLFSAVTEVGQYYFALGHPEADDIFHNTLGSLLGAGASWTVYRCIVAKLEC